MNSKGIYVLLALATVLSCREKGGELPEMLLELGGGSLWVEVASTAEERSLGLKHRDSLPMDRGMLFVFEREHKPSFWMEDTAIPLSIAFIAADGTVRQIEDMVPFSRIPVTSERYVLYALEVNRGLFAQRGVKPGDRIAIPLGLNPR